MNYLVDMQVGYYDDDDTYHGPFRNGASIEAESLDEAIREAEKILRTKMCKLGESENMTDGVILTIHDGTGQLRFDHALGILAEEANRAKTVEEAKANVSACLRKDPMLGRRVRNVLRAVGLETVKAILGPVASIIIAAVEAWNDPITPSQHDKE